MQHLRLFELSNTELEQLARARKNPYYLTLKRPTMDIQLLNRWFNKGYSSREMATFLLTFELNDPDFPKPISPQQVEERWAELHEEVCKLIYTK